MNKFKLSFIISLTCLLLVSFQNFSFVSLGKLHAESALNPAQEKDFQITDEMKESLLLQEQLNLQQKSVYADTYLKQKIESSPLYQKLQFETSAPSPCEQAYLNKENDCSFEKAQAKNNESEENKLSDDIEFKLNPLKNLAKVNFQGPVDATLNFNLGSSNLNFQINKKLNRNQNLKLEMDSRDASTKIEYGLNF